MQGSVLCTLRLVLVHPAKACKFGEKLDRCFGFPLGRGPSQKPAARRIEAFHEDSFKSFTKRRGKQTLDIFKSLRSFQNICNLRSPGMS